MERRIDAAWAQRLNGSIFWLDSVTGWSSHGPMLCWVRHQNRVVILHIMVGPEQEPNVVSADFWI